MEESEYEKAQFIINALMTFENNEYLISGEKREALKIKLYDLLINL